MSGTYTRYTVEDGDGTDQSVIYEESRYAEARDHALKLRGRVIAQEYAWEDSEVVDDFTPDAGDDDGEGDCDA